MNIRLKKTSPWLDIFCRPLMEGDILYDINGRYNKLVFEDGQWLHVYADGARVSVDPAGELLQMRLVSTEAA